MALALLVVNGHAVFCPDEMNGLRDGPCEECMALFCVPVVSNYIPSPEFGTDQI